MQQDDTHFSHTHIDHMLNTLKGHTNSILSLAYSPDGKRLASGSADHTIKLWDVEKGILLRSFELPSDRKLNVQEANLSCVQGLSAAIISLLVARGATR